MLIADPKQAIYAFRGADVYAYLEAAETARRRAPRCASTGAATSRCSTRFDALFADARLGHQEIVYRQVAAAPAHQTPRLLGAPERRRAAHPGRRTAASRRSS